jgi:ferredoxin
VEIAVTGVPVKEVAVPDYRLPDTLQTTMVKNRPLNFVLSYTRFLVLFPEPQRERCTACHTCERICPVQAISIVDRLAVVDHKKCIRCYCCHEMCPEAAIDLRSSPFGRILRWLGLAGHIS